MTNLEKKTITGAVGLFVALWLFIFIPAFSLQFWQGWLYWIIFCLTSIIITIYLAINDKKLLEGRVSAGPLAEKQTSQKVIQAFASLAFIGIFIIAGFDFRFHWSSIPTAFVLLADLLVILGFLIVFRVFKENSFTMATIKVEKEQKLIQTGPYKAVRHPMYAGAFLLILATPIALGSYLGILSALLLIFVIIIRLLDEEKYLSKNLEGYIEYKEKTKYRLIPYIW